MLKSLFPRKPAKLSLEPICAAQTHQDVLQAYIIELRRTWPGQDSHRRPVLLALEQAADEFDSGLGEMLRANRVSALRKLAAECSYQFALLESF